MCTAVIRGEGEMAIEHDPKWTRWFRRKGGSKGRTWPLPRCFLVIHERIAAFAMIGRLSKGGK